MQYIRADQLTIQTDTPAKSRWKLWVEILVTTAIITIVWGLLSLPSVFYFLPQSGLGEPKQVRYIYADTVVIIVAINVGCINKGQIPPGVKG